MGALTQNTVRNFKDIQTSGGTKTTHSMQILSPEKGSVIGMIQSWQPTRSRPIQRIFELNMNTSGQGVDLVPGTVDADTLSVTRIALWKADLFNTFSEAFADATDWLQQKSPFEVNEIWTEPENQGIASDYKGSLVDPDTGEQEEVGTENRTAGGPSIITYFGCWFSEMNPDAYVSQGDKAVSETATIEVLGRSYA